jgi:hypothetical protein
MAFLPSGNRYKGGKLTGIYLNGIFGPSEHSNSMLDNRIWTPIKELTPLAFSQLSTKTNDIFLPPQLHTFSYHFASS